MRRGGCFGGFFRVDGGLRGFGEGGVGEDEDVGRGEKWRKDGVEAF